MKLLATRFLGPKYPAPLFAFLLATTFQPAALGGISYNIAGATYSENFDSLPADAPNNANIQTGANGYPDGWQDDSTVVAGDHVGVPGWYLRHPNAGPLPLPLLEGGANGFQRVRFGPGANTGSFWAFRSTTTPGDIALGSIGSRTVADDGNVMYMALQLVNNTGATLNQFTVTFDGEQWRDGEPVTGETLTFSYSLSADSSNWFTGSGFTPVPALNFTSPVVSGTGTSGTVVDGNTTGRVPDITATVTGISWAPGTELWLRWGDVQIGNGSLQPSVADDGLAIDNVRFAASISVAPPVEDADIAFSENEGGQLQVEWTGNSAFSSHVEHSTDLQTWSSLSAPAQEFDATMAFVIPPDLLPGRHFFKVPRTAAP